MSGTTSTSTRPRVTPGCSSPASSSEVKSAQRRSDDYRAVRQIDERGVDVESEAGQPVIARLRPVRFTVTAGVKRDGLPASFRHRRRRPAPGVSGLAAAVQEDDDRSIPGPRRSPRSWIPPEPSNVNVVGS